MSQVLDGSERILVIPADALDGMKGLSGYIPCREDGGMNWHGRLIRVNLLSAKFLPRTEDLEHGPGGLAWLQVIPYALFHHAGKVFAYRRPAKGGDRRLAGRCSIGIGGHVNPLGYETAHPFGEPAAAILASLFRENLEEMGIEDVVAPRLAGLLWDDRDDIGKRHLGLVYVCEVQPEQVEPQAAEVEPIGWCMPGELRLGWPAEWESWSALLIDHLDAIIAPAPATVPAT